MDTAGHVAQQTTVQAPMTSFGWEKAVGLFVVAILPALFWCGVAYLIAPLFGFTISLSALVIAGLVIAVFLALVYAGISASS